MPWKTPSNRDSDPSRRDTLLRGAFDDAPIGMALVSLDGRWLRVNDALCDIVGYSGDELLATDFVALTHPEDRVRGLELNRQLLSGACARYQYEKRYVHREGHSVWASVTVALLRDGEQRSSVQLAQIQDITERVQASEALRESEALLRATQELANVGSWALHVGTGALIWTDELYRIFGLDARTAPASYDDFLRGIHPDDRARVEELLASAMQRRTPFDFDHRIVRPDGSVREVHCRGRVIVGEHGTVARVFGSSQDITDRRHLEDQLRQALKMEAVGRLAGGVAHDFNNLLTVIRSNATFLMEDLGQFDKRREDAVQILGAADRAAGLTRQLLAFSRKQILHPQPLDLHDIVRSVVAMLERVIGEDIVLVTDLAPIPLPVLADPGQLEQVLINLAVNARDAMPDGGTVTLRTGVVDVDAQSGAAVSGLAHGRHVSLVVEDTGAGISPEVLPRIFEPFYTTKGRHGTGLGLATVHGIVEQSGGRIFVDSVEGRGSRFTVLLPRRDAPRPEAIAAAATPTSRGSERILVVEDEAPVRMAVARMLSRLGYGVIEAGDGAEALGIVETSMRRIHLILTDVVMADVHGRLLAESVEIQAPNIPVLYMSGYTDDDILRRGLTNSGITLLQKPFTLDTLARAVRDTIDGARATPEKG
jgi:two-component system cell cycle sensor histidine kinase/response regulator CckA